MTGARAHIVMTFDETRTQRLYIDGTLTTERSSTIGVTTWPDSAPFSIANVPTDGRPWLGTFHWVARREDSEVDQLRAALARPPHVARRHVPVNEAANVKERERRRHVTKQEARLGDADPGGSAQIRAVEELHRVVRPAFVLAHLHIVSTDGVFVLDKSRMGRPHPNWIAYPPRGSTGRDPHRVWTNTRGVTRASRARYAQGIRSP